MTDPDTVPDRIDDAISVCICGRAIPPNGPSLDYCSLPCQNRFFAGPSASVYESHDSGHGTPDGRTINEDVNNWFQESSTARPDMNWASAAEFHSGDAEGNPCQGHTLSTQRVEGGPTRVMWVQNIADPNAPTAAELDAGITLGILDENGHLQAETPALLTPEALNRSLLDLYNTYPGYMEALGAECEPPLTADEFRQRALEHRQNRGTGPAERRQRLPRNHQG